VKGSKDYENPGGVEDDDFEEGEEEGAAGTEEGEILEDGEIASDQEGAADDGEIGEHRVEIGDRPCFMCIMILY